MSIETYSIRLARAEDLPSLRVLEHAASQMFLATPYPEIASETPTSMEEFGRWLADGVLIVAVGNEDKPVGYAIAHALAEDAYLHEIDVDPAHGRQGIGRRLIDYVHAWAAERGFKRLVLSTFSNVPWNAPYYARLGFHELAPDQVESELVEIRRREQAAGLNVSKRVFMATQVRQPN